MNIEENMPTIDSKVADVIAKLFLKYLIDFDVLIETLREAETFVKNYEYCRYYISYSRNWIN